MNRIVTIACILLLGLTVFVVGTKLREQRVVYVHDFPVDSYIRVRNGSDTDFRSVGLQFASASTNGLFGDVAAGATTEYHAFAGAFSYGYVALYVGTNRFEIMPVDYVGAQPLGSGHFTFHLTIDNGRLTRRTEVD